MVVIVAARQELTKLEDKREKPKGSRYRKG